MGKKKSSVDITHLKINNKISSNPQEMANEINKSFSENISSTVINPKHKPSENSITHSMFLNPTTEEEVHKTIQSLKNSKCHQHNDMPVFMWKLISDYITLPLKRIINHSFESGVFPDTLKTAKIVPLYKSGDRESCTNYRPISILKVLSKIFEKIFLSRIQCFIEKNKIIPSSQYGFKRNNSTKDALLYALINTEISQSKNKISAALLLDLSKAFDKVIHEILLKKLYCYGLRGKSYFWIKSYLKDRKFNTEVNGCSSDYLEIKRGVPQGAILSPTFYSIYVADYESQTKEDLVQYADDTNHLISSKDTKSLSTKTQNCYTNSEKYFQNNELELNGKKTEIIVFQKQTEITLTLNSHYISSVPTVKFLGVILDKELRFSQHITNVKKKINCLLPLVYHTKNFLPREAKYNIYYGFVYPHIKYCALFICKSSKHDLQQLDICQKRFLKILFGIPKRTKSVLMFNTLRLQSVDAIIQTEILCFMHKVYNNCAPLPLLKLFFKSERSTNFVLYHQKGCFSFINYYSQLWNNLPVNFHQCSTIARLYLKWY